MKKIKRIISLGLVLIMCLSCINILPVKVAASDNIDFQVNQINANEFDLIFDITDYENVERVGCAIWTVEYGSDDYSWFDGEINGNNAVVRVSVQKKTDYYFIVYAFYDDGKYDKIIMSDTYLDAVEENTEAQDSDNFIQEIVNKIVEFFKKIIDFFEGLKDGFKNSTDNPWDTKSEQELIEAFLKLVSHNDEKIYEEKKNMIYSQDDPIGYVLGYCLGVYFYNGDSEQGIHLVKKLRESGLTDKEANDLLKACLASDIESVDKKFEELAKKYEQ